MGLMYRVIKKYREHVSPDMHNNPRNPQQRQNSDVISTDNFLNVYFAQVR